MLLNLPILCVDLIIQNSEGEFLLVKRDNHPIKGYDWVPGGRMRILCGHIPHALAQQLNHAVNRIPWLLVRPMHFINLTGEFKFGSENDDPKSGDIKRTCGFLGCQYAHGTS